MAETHDWDEQQRLLLQHWPALDQKALGDTKGEREGILALLEGRLGYARANAERDYDELMSGESSVGANDVADDKQHTGTSGPVGDAHGTEHAMEGGRAEVRERLGTIPGTPVGGGEATMPGATTDAKLAEEYAEGDQGAARLESDNSDEKAVPPDMAKDGSADERLRRAS